MGRFRGCGACRSSDSSCASTVGSFLKRACGSRDSPCMCERASTVPRSPLDDDDIEVAFTAIDVNADMPAVATNDQIDARVADGEVPDVETIEVIGQHGAHQSQPFEWSIAVDTEHG